MFTCRLRRFLKFLIPSLLGAIIFIVPYQVHGMWNSTLGHIEEWIIEVFASSLPFAALCTVAISACVTAYAVVARPRFISENPFLSEFFLTGPFWAVSRAAGAVFAVLIYYNIGPEMLCRTHTGGVLLYSLAPRVLSLAAVLGITIPLLLDFGLIEFIGTLTRPIMRPLFNLPGRSSVDCLASWVGSGELAVMLTVKLHEERVYSDREAAVIATSFSVIGIPYVYAVAELTGIIQYFGYLCFAIYSTLLLLALTMPRIWPLNRIPDCYAGREGKKKEVTEELPHHFSLVEWALIVAQNRAYSMTAKRYLISMSHLFISLACCTLPLVIAWGGVFLLVAHVTPFFTWLAVPFEGVLSLVGIPEADHVSASVAVAFVDQFLGAVVALDCKTEAAKFLCVCLSATALISVTETGTHIWHSGIPLGFIKLTLLYVLRAVLSLILLVPLTLLYF